MRGRFNSDGEFTPYIHDTEDGYDVIEWIAAQEWCDGNIGMAGGSCVARTQWLAAAANPPHLKAIVPVVSPPDAYLNEPITHGCFLLPVSEWMLWMGRRSWQLTDADPIYTHMRPYFNTLPLADVAQAAGIQSRWWDEWMQHPNLDAYWTARLLHARLGPDVGRGAQHQRLVGHELPRRAPELRRHARARPQRCPARGPEADHRPLAAPGEPHPHAQWAGLRRAGHHQPGGVPAALLRSLAEGRRQRHRQRAAGPRLRARRQRVVDRAGLAAARCRGRAVLFPLARTRQSA